VEAIVAQADGNESEAARRIGVTRLRINRVRKQAGAVTAAVRVDLWRRIEQLSAVASPAKKDTNDTDAIQIVRDVPHVALQVLRYMTDAIERDMGMEGRASAK
ncbi:MAG: hypothetical protein ABL931_21595, partial [Usitatibacteraceae bacterium]